MKTLYLDMNIYDRLVRQGKKLLEAGELALQVINPVDLLREEQEWR